MAARRWAGAWWARARRRGRDGGEGAAGARESERERKKALTVGMYACFAECP
jgi:hypothetical protein